MQNLIVVCSRCYSWVETHSELCPECASDVCLDTPDLATDAFAEVLGNPITELGPLRLERRDLPNYGSLVGTTTGILFLPRLHRRMNGAWEGLTSQRTPSWWPFHGDAQSPRFLSWLRQPLGSMIPSTPLASLPSLSEAESLIDRFFDSPGAFFLPQRSIKSITARRRQIRIDRSPIRSVTLIDESDDGTLYANLNRMNSV